MAGWDTAKAAKLKEGMEKTVDSLSMDDVKSEGMTIRIGGKIVKLQFTEEVSLPEEEIRAEYSRKLTEKLQSIKDALNEKMSEMSYMVEQNRQDFEEKERQLQARLANANLMPEISYEHAKAGLSVVKGHPSYRGDKDVLTWLYQGVYWPKTYNQRPLDPKFTKKLISPVCIEIVTIGNRVGSVTVRKTIGLGKFDHYHKMGSGDCWGQWQYAKTWNSPADILAIGQRAIAVLENVNGMSPGNRTPAGLPRINTLEGKVVSAEAARAAEAEVSRVDQRAGVEEAPARDAGMNTVWTVG